MIAGGIVMHLDVTVLIKKVKQSTLAFARIAKPQLFDKTMGIYHVEQPGIT